MSTRLEADVAVIGGGLVGMAIGCGLVRRGIRTIVLDEGDRAIRASRGNFGLVWVQGKGELLPAYTPWAMRAASEWPNLATWLREYTGIDVGLDQSGGLFLCMTEEDLENRRTQLAHVKSHYGKPYDYEILDNAGVRKMVSEVGPKIAGASYSPYDGHVNPIRLFRALHRAYGQLSGSYQPGGAVSGISHVAGGYVMETPKATVHAERIVLASGLGNVGLGRYLGVPVPVRPMRGQIMVTERLPPLFRIAMEQVRQTDDGTLLLGTSWEDVGFDLSTTYQVTKRIATNAIDFFPMLRDVNVVRSWAALRILSPDASPIYDEVAPGAFLVTCHSGVSLASNHVFDVPEWIANGAIPASMQSFSLKRFGSRPDTESIRVA